MKRRSDYRKENDAFYAFWRQAREQDGCQDGKSRTNAQAEREKRTREQSREGGLYVKYP